MHNRFLGKSRGYFFQEYPEIGLLGCFMCRYNRHFINIFDKANKKRQILFVSSSSASFDLNLIERMESRYGIHTLEHAEAIAIGSQKYNLIRLDA